MSELHTFIQQHAQVGPRGAAGGVDVYFFTVKAAPGANAATLQALVRAHKGVHVEVDLFDGKEHGYPEIGAWLGSQEAALALIGLGTQLELWQLLSPRTMLGVDVPAEVEETLAGQGLISLQAFPAPSASVKPGEA